MTIKLYQQDVYQRHTEAVITAVRENGIITDRTVFFPEGGGQSSDIGIITRPENKEKVWPVDHASEDGDDIFHRIPGGTEGLASGDHVLLSIDWDHRFDNMQRHAGEHILSGAFYRLFGGANRGFHMGKEGMTIDIALPADSPDDRITWEMAEEAERNANHVIWEDEPITTDYFQKRSQAESMPLRKPLAFDEDISIVTIGPRDHPADCVACCGTHPSTSGQVGLIKIFKLESNKGMTRIFFEAGRRAFLRWQQDTDLLYDLSLRLSAGTGDILDKFDAQQRRNQEIRDELHALRSALAKKEAAFIRDALKNLSGSQNPVPVLIRRYPDRNPEQLQDISRLLSGSIPGLAILVSGCTCLLASSGTKNKEDLTLHCGNIVKEKGKPFGARGGGNDRSARAVFDSPEDTEGFLRSLQSAAALE